jgi:hypothetical protein
MFISDDQGYIIQKDIAIELILEYNGFNNY